MNLKKVLIIIVSVSMILLLATAFVAEAGRSGPHMQKRGMRSGLAGLRAFLDLKLSDSQQEAMTSIIDKYRNQKETLRNGMIEVRKNLMAALHAEPFNEVEARKAFRENSTVGEDMFVLRAKMMVEMKAVLTPEQLERLKERKVKRIGRMKKRFGARSEKPSE